MIMYRITSWLDPLLIAALPPLVGMFLVLPVPSRPPAIPCCNWWEREVRGEEGGVRGTHGMDAGEKKRGRHQDGDGDASSSGQRRRLCDASRTTVGGETAHSHDTTKPFPDRVTAAAHGGRDVEEERVVDYRDGDAAGSCGHQRGVCAPGSTLEEAAESSRSRGLSSEEDEDEEEEEGGGVEGDGNDGRYSDDGLGLRVEHISVEECAFLYDEIFVRREYTKRATLKAGQGDVLDVGANIGLFSLFAHKEMQSSGSDKIWAFEPVGCIFEVLERNLSGIDSARARRYGLGAFPSEEERFFYYPQCPGESSRHADESRNMRKIMGGADGEGVACNGSVRRLSDVLREEGITKVQLLKVDVEGDEMNVLMGIDDGDWPMIQQVVMEVHDVGFRLLRCTALLERKGFTVCAEKQTSVWDAEGASLNFVPSELKLYYVHALRPRDTVGA